MQKNKQTKQNPSLNEVFFDNEIGGKKNRIKAVKKIENIKELQEQFIVKEDFGSGVLNEMFNIGKNGYAVYSLNNGGFEITTSGSSHSGISLYTKNPLEKKGIYKIDVDVSAGSVYNSAAGFNFAIGSYNSKPKTEFYGTIITNALNHFNNPQYGTFFIERVTGIDTSKLNKINSVIPFDNTQVHVTYIMNFDTNIMEMYLNDKLICSFKVSDAQINAFGDDIQFFIGYGNYSNSSTAIISNLSISKLV